MKRQTVPRTIAGLVVLLALTLPACGSQSTGSTSSGGSAGGPASVAVLRLAGGSDWGYPTPFAGSRGPSTAHASLIFDSLIWKDSKGDFIPWLATKWESSSDGTQWRFTLRDGVKFTDGQAFTADDVVFSYKYQTTGAGKVSPLGWSGLPHFDVSADSPTAVVFKATQPYAVFLNNIALRLPIMPQHIWASVADPLKFQGPTAVIGTGAYQLQAYDAASGTYLYTANPSFFLGAPYVKRLEFVPAPDPLLALKRGDIDMAEIGAGGISDGGVAPSSLDVFKDPTYGTTSASGTVGRTLHFNLTKGFPYNDVRFRQALAYAIDRKDLSDRILLSTGEVANLGMIEPADSPWVPKDLPTYPHDIAKANALLDQLGLKLVNGVRRMPDGSTFSPEMLTSSARWNPLTPVLIKEYLGQVGITLTVKSVDQSTADSATTAGNYTIALIGYGHATDPDSIRSDLSSQATHKSFAGVFGWNNPAFEDAAAKELTTVDRAARTQLAYTMQQAVAQDLPVIALYVSKRMAIYTNSVVPTWYYTPGGGPLYPGLINKLIYIHVPAVSQ